MKHRTITETADMPDRVFGSSAFTDVIFARRSASKPCRAAAGDIEIRVSAPTVRPTQMLCITGDCDALGHWDTSRALPLNDSAFPEWSLCLPASSLPEQFEYKFIIRERSTGAFVAWEEGFNRRFEYFHPSSDEVLTVVVPPLRNPLHWRGAGTAIPVFSLRSEQSVGCGEFCDLKLLVDWVAATGQCLIQILPVNDTTCTGTWRDSYPYSANSIYALHPQYLRLREAGLLSDKDMQQRFDDLGRELNALPAVDCERVNTLKHEYMRILYGEQGSAVAASDDYRAFFDANGWWLKPYAVYSVLRDSLQTVDFTQWGEYSEYSEPKVDAFVAEHAYETGYWFFLQYHLDRQLREVRNYAHSRGVILKGDIPIGVSRTSVDAWMTPALFRMDSSAGAPPDDFAVKGQNWGFPTYDWERMSADGYAWWKSRFVKMNDYFDAYRIDHILGFFRIWEIPLRAVNALLGHFNPSLPLSAGEIESYGFRFDRERHTAPVDVTDDVLVVEDPQHAEFYHPRIGAQSTSCYACLTAAERAAYDRLYEEYFYRRHDAYWRATAVRRLMPLITSTRMLVCGEDLGMIPSCVPEVMKELDILSLEIERMPKTPGCEFGDPKCYPYRSVCSPSTHDMPNIRLWWSESTSSRQRYYNDVMGCSGDAPAECTPWICEWILRRQLSSSSLLTVVPLQDWLSLDAGLRRRDAAAERINVPANPDHCWNYRMHITLECLLASREFNARVHDLVLLSGRDCGQ